VLKCREIPEATSLLIDGQLTWQARMALRLHAFLCNHCRRYVSNAMILRAALQRRQTPLAQVDAQVVTKKVCADETHLGIDQISEDAL